MQITQEAISRTAAAYAVAALWSEVGQDGEPLDTHYSVDDIAEATRRRFYEECEHFLKRAAPFLAHLEAAMWEQTQAPDGHFYDLWERAGHDLWLTRNGHGAGFWDRPELWGATQSNSLAAIATNMGQVYLEAGDDGQVHQMGV